MNHETIIRSNYAGTTILTNDPDITRKLAGDPGVAAEQITDEQTLFTTERHLLDVFKMIYHDDLS